jgi:hypothetical protein
LGVVDQDQIAATPGEDARPFRRNLSKSPSLGDVRADLLRVLDLTRMFQHLLELTCSGQIESDERVARRSEEQARDLEVVEPRLDLALGYGDTKLFE